MGNQCAHGVRPAFFPQIRGAVERGEPRLPQCGRVTDVVEPARGDERVHRGSGKRDAQRLSPLCHRCQVAEAIRVLAHDALGEIASFRDERLGHGGLKFTPYQRDRRGGTRSDCLAWASVGGKAFFGNFRLPLALQRLRTAGEGRAEA
jgi:hypothetical protein